MDQREKDQFDAARKTVIAKYHEHPFYRALSEYILHLEKLLDENHIDIWEEDKRVLTRVK